MNQVTRGSSIPTLKGSLTRAKNAYMESYRLCQKAIKDVDDEDLKAQQLQQLGKWELTQLKWQDERDRHILIQENPEVRDDSQQARDIQYESLYGRAKSRANDAINQTTVIHRNLGTSITNKALDSIKNQCSAAEDEFEHKLWPEFEELIKLKPDQSQTLIQEFTTHRKTLREDNAKLLSQALSLIPSSSTAQSMPSNQNIACSSAGKSQHSYTKEKLPVFDGDYRAYSRWSRQWKDAQSHYGEDQFILIMQNNTPSHIDVLANNTLAEIWEQLDAHYASTRVVSEQTLADYSAFIPMEKSKNERLIEVANHVNKTHGDLLRVGKESEMEKTEHLILKVLKWLDVYHKDELVDLFNADEKVPVTQRQGVFQITTTYLKQTRLNLLKYTVFSPQVSQPEKPLKKTHGKAHDFHLHNQERQPAGRPNDQGGNHQRSPPDNVLINLIEVNNLH